MALSKLVTPASPEGYKVGFADDLLSVRYDGPSGKYRMGAYGSPKVVQVQWELRPSGYLYFRAFWRTRLKRGVLPFLIDLVAKDATRTEHLATFMPGTLKLAEWTGHRYVVSAQLELARVI